MKYQAEVTTDSGRAYLHTRTAGAVLPLLQASITGLLLTVPVVILLVKVRVQDWLTWGGLCFALITAATWLYSQRHWFTLTSVERVSGQDLNGDGVIGAAPSEAVRPVRIDIQEFEQGRPTQTTRARFRNERKMVAIAEALLVRGLPFSVGVLVEKEKLLTRGEFEEIRAEMERRGMLRLRDREKPKLGYELTRAGKASLRSLIDAPHSPTE